jgi:hypothetical protein
MKKLFFLYIFDLCLYPIYSQDIYGSYKSKSFPELKEIVLNRDSSFYIIEKTPDIYQYTDTLTFGKFKITDNKIIELNSSYQELANIQFSFINMNVKEEVGNNSDSLYFIIKNSFEENICKNLPYERRPIYYNISLNGGSDDFRNYIYEQFSNYCQIAKKDLYYFSISVIPNNLTFSGYLSLREIETDIYNILNKKSNIFIINLPNLNVNFLCQKRLYSEYLLRENNNTLIWQGEKYIK